MGNTFMTKANLAIRDFGWDLHNVCSWAEYKIGGLDYEDWQRRYVKGCIGKFRVAEELGKDVSKERKEFLNRVANFGREGWR